MTHIYYVSMNLVIISPGTGSSTVRQQVNTLKNIAVLSIGLKSISPNGVARP